MSEQSGNQDVSENVLEGALESSTLVSGSSDVKMMESSSNVSDEKLDMSGYFVGATEREAFAKMMQSRMADRGQQASHSAVHEDNDARQVDDFYKELNRNISESKDKLERKANSFTDEELARAIPGLLNKFLGNISWVWRKNRHHGVIDLCFQDRRHAQAMWVMSQMTHGSYGRAEDIQNGKNKDLMPKVSLVKAGTPAFDDLASTLFPKITIDEELCSKSMPVVARIYSDEKSTGKTHMCVTMLYDVLAPYVQEASENILPVFLEKRLLQQGGPKEVRRHIVNAALYDASVKTLTDLFLNESVAREVEEYVERNAYGVLSIGVERNTEGDDGEIYTDQNTIKVSISLVDYPDSS